ncbi:2-hydroxy-3-oxopropionate reductase [Paraburkholderia domus]|uniref:NAD(P)-dependent oxidoreductase n=1 Tax=Paraburkholderia domus TaxID=2793075 RepID=UPI0019148CE4|nr:NAD(P)-dependent oxidoreductase [Paraburkholderia domus]MBK5053297.1 NAD(P)-dependent oxidoreductase [Burkholderia sp. R-70006]MBK5065228.1 NAD(P)-dependent oxidoreductase [Burkholderia sp. R-70199]MBK5090053.1 NAD(P)-dependent oxidoreductase [Burkholderia sp. R-69927]MBK5124608.1 NAD(P)-dependent oxidoreductase [Burkholderia sp. R-69980]MBK5182028.1 NAD(P)-dependent oxidoreductase [Burkholderia sp. R-69749]MCI0149960.1 NAD-binding protein [Paraburkholderia sediminicola]
MEIGFCGPGLMGAPMIRHLLRAGHAVHVWNRTRAKAEALSADGAKVVDTPRELASRCEVVLLCLADAAAVEETVFGAVGLLSADATATRRLRWIVDHSSIPPAVTRAFARRAATAAEAAASAAAGEGQGEREPEGDGATSVGWIDAPVSGGVAGATAGTLAIMAGGAAADVEAVTPLLGAYSARVTHMGNVGAGQTTKLCNQTIVTATLAAIAEAVSLAQRSGIDAAKLSEGLAGGWADSVLLQIFVPRMTQSGLAPIGAFRTFQKDIDTVAATAYETGTPMPVSSTVQQLLRLGAAMGLGEADLSAFIDVLQTPRGA